MYKFNVMRGVQSAIVTLVVGSLAASDAHAWSFGSWGSFGGWGSCGSYGSYGYTSYPSVRYFSSGSYGSYGSYRGYGSYGRVGSAWAYDRDIYADYPAPADYAPEAPQPPEREAVATSEATIHLSVPPDARVFVNDQPTDSTGSERDFVSRGLDGDQSYVYRLRVEFEEEGQALVENKAVRIKAGDAIDLKFGDAEKLASR